MGVFRFLSALGFSPFSPFFAPTFCPSYPYIYRAGAHRADARILAYATCICVCIVYTQECVCVWCAHRDACERFGKKGGHILIRKKYSPILQAAYSLKKETKKIIGISPFRLHFFIGYDIIAKYEICILFGGTSNALSNNERNFCKSVC